MISISSFVTIYLKEKIYVLAGGFIQFQLRLKVALIYENGGPENLLLLTEFHANYIKTVSFVNTPGGHDDAI